MFNSISSNLLFVENSPVSSILFDTVKKCTKITCIAIAILGAFTAVIYIYRHFKAQIKSPGTDPISPPSRSSYPRQVQHSTSNDRLLAQFLQKEEEEEEEEYDDDDEKEEKKYGFSIQYQWDSSDGKRQSHTPHIPPYQPRFPLPLHSVTTSRPLVRAEDDSPFQQIDSICAQIEERIFSDSRCSAVTAFNSARDITSHAQGLLNEIVEEFERRYPREITPSKKVKYREPVPEYYANGADGRSSIDRKYLALVGIRNLLYCGSSVIDHFRDKGFIGGEHHYDADKGLRAFKYYTGNVVDLDTEFNAANDAEAVKKAEDMIIKFGKLCGLKNREGSDLTAAAVASSLPSRKLDLPDLRRGFIHTATSHRDRSNHGIWKHGFNYYVNVPNPTVVILATLRLPYLLADLLYRTKQKNDGKLLKEFYDKFFAKGLSDKCFNDKAREFIQFYHEWRAKLDGVCSPEEDARKKVIQGTFGGYIQSLGPDAAIRTAKTRQDLTNLFDTHLLLPPNGRSLDQWRREEKAKIIHFLRDQGLWERALYQTDKGSPFFLINEETLSNSLLKDYHQYLVDYDNLSNG